MLHSKKTNKEKVVVEKKEEDKDLKDLVKESVELNKETLSNIKFIKRYYHLRSVWNLIKVGIAVIFIITSVISAKSMVNYMQKIQGSNTDLLNQIQTIKNLEDQLK